MTAFVIRYRAYDGTETERRISDLVLDESKGVDAFCHLRNERRTFVFSRIVSAVNAETGELVDLTAMFGVKLPRPPVPRPTLRTAAEMQLLKRGSEEYKRQRNTEKRELRKPFGLEIVYEHFKEQLLGLFGNCCAKCRRMLALDLDHHVPMVLGGRLVPGNIGALCRRCNNAKGDRPPQDFYSDSELQWIARILDQQVALFAFRFDWSRWREDRRGYLLSIGIDPGLVVEIFTNPNHKWYIEQQSEIGVRFGVENFDEVMQGKHREL